MGTLEAFPLRAACLLHKPMLLWCTGAAVTIRLPPRNGVIDRHELKALLQSTDNGFQPVTLVRAWLAVHPCATPVPSRPVQRPHRPRCCHPRQDWMEDREVKETLQKYDWDGSGDIDIHEFEGLVQDGMLMEGKLEEYQRAWQARLFALPTPPSILQECMR